MTAKVKRGKQYRYNPVGLDIYDRRSYQPEPGTLVTVTQPFGCPPNGTMGHCYVEWPEGGPVLVLVNSLEAV